MIAILVLTIAVPPPALTVTVGSARLPIVSAVAVPDGNEIDLQLATWPLTCKDLRGLIPSDGRHLDLKIVKKLRPDGTWSWTHHGTYFEGTSSEGGMGEALANAAIDTTAGARVRFDLGAVVLEATDDRGEIEVRGTIDAETCPAAAPPASAAPVPRPQPGAFLEVAGQKIPIVGAAFQRAKAGYHLLVASGEVRCVDGSSGLEGTKTFVAASRPDVSLKLEYAKMYDTKDGKPYSGVLEGAWIDSWHSADGAALTVAPRKPGGGGKSVTVTLGGGPATLGGYAVSWSGKVKAIVCP